MRRFMPVVLVVVGFLGIVGWRELRAWWDRAPDVPAGVAQGGWIEERLANYRFESPWGLRPRAAEIPPAAADQVVSSKFLFGEAEGLTVGASVFTYRAAIDLDQSADAVIESLTTITPPRPHEAPSATTPPMKFESRLDEERAIDLEVVFRNGPTMLRYQAVVFLDGNDLYQFMVLSLADQTPATAAWRRLRTSIQRVERGSSRR